MDPSIQAHLVDHNARLLGTSVSIDHNPLLRERGSGGGDHHEQHVTQSNQITINAPDPHTAAAMVGLHVDRNAADLARNLQGAAQ
jgi:hypothetical protein